MLKKCDISNNNSQFWKREENAWIADVICYWKMTSFMVLDGVTSFLLLKDVTNTCKYMRRSLSIGGSSSVQWRKVGRSWRLQMCFRRLLCVRIEIDPVRELLSNNSLFVSQLYEDKSLVLRAHDLIFFTTDNSKLLLNNSLLELIYFLNVQIWWLICHLTDSIVVT